MGPEVVGLGWTEQVVGLSFSRRIWNMDNMKHWQPMHRAARGRFQGSQVWVLRTARAHDCQTCVTDQQPHVFANKTANFMRNPEGSRNGLGAEKECDPLMRSCLDGQGGGGGVGGGVDNLIQPPFIRNPVPPLP